METLEKKIQLLLNLYKSKNLSKVESYSKELINSHPKIVVLYNILGLVLAEQNKIDEAVTYYEEGIKIDPNFSMIYNNLGSIYRLKKNNKKAEDYFKKSINLDRNISEPHNNLGNLYLSLNKHKDAIECYKNAITINPKFFLAYYNLGLVYKSLGRFDEAKKYLEESIKLNNYFFTAHRNLSQVVTYKKNNEHFNLLKKIFNDIKIKKNQKTELAFALAKAFDDIKDYKSAFQYYVTGNYLRRKNILFSKKKEKAEFSNIKKIFNKRLFKKYEKSGNLNSTPIFILGMPRSGTTLVEQIISSHPKVYGGDELNLLPNLINKYFDNKEKKINLKNLINFDIDRLNHIGQEYINSIKNISNNSERVTDKLPINFKWIGIIKMILPNSKIIHCTRSPKDNCLSIFKTYFTNSSLNFAYNLEELSMYYNLYNDLMKHWADTLPNFINEIKYENIVQKPEEEIRSLLKVCSLEWDDNCIQFYNNQRPINTASDIQARKKIYKTSVDSWKNYKKYVKKNFDKLAS